jgi:hypothetical protein
VPVADLDDAAWSLLHELRLRNLIDDPSDAVADLLVSRDFAHRRNGHLLLTPAGRALHAEWARVPARTDAEAALTRVYEAFLPLNRELVATCTAWQVRPGGVANDHTDAHYDWSCIDRLDAIDERAGAVVRRLSRAVERFGPYRPRLRSARLRVHDGEGDWFTSPRVDSYHTVWMQLHEDLLLALGRDRDTEPT